MIHADWPIENGEFTHFQLAQAVEAPRSGPKVATWTTWTAWTAGSGWQSLPCWMNCLQKTYASHLKWRH